MWSIKVYNTRIPIQQVFQFIKVERCKLYINVDSWTVYNMNVHACSVNNSVSISYSKIKIQSE